MGGYTSLLSSEMCVCVCVRWVLVVVCVKGKGERMVASLLIFPPTCPGPGGAGRGGVSSRAVGTYS